MQHALPRHPRTQPQPVDHEHGSSVVEYVGLGALATMLVSGVAAAIDSGTGERLGSLLVRHLIEVISTG